MALNGGKGCEGMKLSGKVALVTGAAGGIGLAIGKKFCDEGASVVMTDIQAKELTAVCGKLGTVSMVQDVSQESEWRKVIDMIRESHGRLDILVNNAGIVSNKSIAETDMDTWNTVVGTNLTSVMLGCRFAIELMRNNPGGSGGSIVNIASTTSFLGLANDLVYTTTKTALVGLTRSVATWCALERLNIRCNTLHPGAIYTAILKAHVDEDPALFDVFSNMAPVGRMGTVEEVANLALFLASDDSSFSTGAQFVADGGISMAHPRM